MMGKSSLWYIDPPHLCMSFGAFRAFCGIKDSIPLFHSPVGCIFHIMMCMGRQVRDPVRLRGLIAECLCTNLSMQDAIFGAEEKLKDSIIDIYKRHSPKLIGVISSCIAETIGEDIAKVTKDVEPEVKCKLVPLPISGYRGDHIEGFSTALVEISKVVMERGEVAPKSVNLLGAISDEYTTMMDIEEVTDLLGMLGLGVNCVLTHATSVDDIKKAPTAELNIVLYEETGLECAEFMEKEFGTPYICEPAPFGVEGTNEWLRRIAEQFNLTHKVEEIVNDKSKLMYDRLTQAIQYLGGRRVAIITNPTIAVGLARLVSEIGMKPTVICLQARGYRSSEFLNDVIKKYNISPKVLIKSDYSEFENEVKKSRAEVIFGSSRELILAHQIGAMDVCVSWPATHALSVYHMPIMGYNGILALAQRIGEHMLRRTLFGETVYGLRHLDEME